MTNFAVAEHCEPFGFIVALHPNARVLMTRDMELIRRILLEIQSRKDFAMRPVQLDGIDDMTLRRHVEILHQAGYVEGAPHKTTSEPPVIYVTDLTWEGHDFISVLNNDSVWSAIKKSFSPTELVGMPLSVLKDVGLALLKAWAMKKVKDFLGGGGDT